MSEIVAHGDLRFKRPKEDKKTERKAGEVTREVKLKITKAETTADKITRIWGKLISKQIDDDPKIDMYSLNESTGILTLSTSHEGYVPSYIQDKPNIQMSEKTIKWEIEN